MASAGELKLKITMLTDGLKQALGNARQYVENFRKAASQDSKTDFTDALKIKIAQADAELKKATSEVEKLKAALAGKSGALADSINQEIGKAEARIRSTTSELDKLKAKLNTASSNALANDANARLNQVGKTADGLRGKLESTFGNIGSMMVGAFAIGSLVAFTKSLLDTVQKIQDLRIRISGLTTSARDYAASEAYLVDLSARHHKSIEQLSDSYAQFLTLERSGIITRQQTIQLTEGFSNVASKTGTNVVQMGQSVYGLSQLLSAGVVKMQDFRQVTDPMPGLMNKIADSFGYTVGQLRELVASGGLTSDEFGQKFVVALKDYEGAAARSAGTISATYADVENAKVEMAKELERPIANAFLTFMDGVKEAYKVLSDNSEAIVYGVTAVGVVMASKAAGGVATYTQAIFANINAEKLAQAEMIKTANARLATKQTYVVLAQAKVKEAESALFLARGETEAAVATLRLASANKYLAASQTAAATAQTALNTTVAQSSILMARLGSAAKSAMAFLGGPVGVAVVGLYLLYEVLNKVFNVERDAEEAAKRYSEALDKINESVKNLNAEQVQVETGKAQNEAEQLHAKLAKLEEFNFDNVKNFWGNADKRQVLLNDLKLAEDKLKALNEQDLELIKNFDATKLDKDALQGALKETQGSLKLLSDEAGALDKKLHEQGKLSFYEQKQLNDDNLRISAFEAKESALQKQIKLTSGSTQEAITKKKRAAAKEATKAVIDELKEVTKEEDAEMARRMELVNNNLTQRQTAIELSKGSAAKKEEEITAAVKAAGDAQLLIIKSNGLEKLRIADETFAAEMAKHKEGSFMYKSLEAEKLQHGLDVYRSMEKSYSETVTRQISEEKRLVQVAKQLANERKGIEQSYEDFKRQLHNGGLTDAQRNAEDRKRLDKLVSDHRKALGNKDFSLAAELDQRILELGKKMAVDTQGTVNEVRKIKEQNADYQLRIEKLSRQHRAALAKGDVQDAKDAANAIKQIQDDIAKNKAEVTGASQSQVDAIVTITDAAQKRILDVNKTAQDANKQRLNDTKANADNAKEQLVGVQAEIANLTKELTTKGFMLTMNADTKAVDEAIARIIKPTESTHTIKVNEQKVTRKDGGIVAYATGGHVVGEGTGTSDSIPAMISNGEYVIKTDSVNKLGVETLDYLNSKGQLPKFAGGGLVGTPSYQPSFTPNQAQASSGETFTLHLAMPDGSTGTVTGNKKGNESLLDAIAQAVNQQARSMS